MPEIQLLVSCLVIVATVAALAGEMAPIDWYIGHLANSGEDLATYAVIKFCL